MSQCLTGKTDLGVTAVFKQWVLIETGRISGVEEGDLLKTPGEPGAKKRIFDDRYVRSLPCDRLSRLSADRLSSSALWVRPSEPSTARSDDTLSGTLT